MQKTLSAVLIMIYFSPIGWVLCLFNLFFCSQVYMHENFEYLSKEKKVMLDQSIKWNLAALIISLIECCVIMGLR